MLYSPLDGDETRQFTNPSSQPEVIIPRAGLYELISNNGTDDIEINGVTFEHTDVAFSECFAQGCAGQSVSWLTKAAIHFESSARLSLVNVSIKHVGGHGLWFGPACRDSFITDSYIGDLAAGAVRIGGSYRGAEAKRLGKTAMNITVSDTVIRDGGNIFRSGMGVLLQAAANCTITHNQISEFRQTGISMGWEWVYEPTSDSNNLVSFNNISTIGMGETSDLACVYHLGQDRGSVIDNNLCSNVTSYDYGGTAYYLDQASQFVTVTNNLAVDIKCAGLLQNFGLNCTIRNNIFAFVSENQFKAGSDFSGQTCAGNTGAAIYTSGPASGEFGAAFEFSHNVVYWRQGPLFGGGSSLFVSNFQDNLYYNAADPSGQWQSRSFPCLQSFGPFDPSTAEGVIYEDQILEKGQVLLSHGKQSWATIQANGSFCVGKGDVAEHHVAWCSGGQAGSRAVMQEGGNFCVYSGNTSVWCARPEHVPHQGGYYAELQDDASFCIFKENYPPPGSSATWCRNGSTAAESTNLGFAPVSCSFDAWQRKGHDPRSRIVDPQFVDPLARDFRFEATSPALAMGIKSVDMSTVGPRSKR